MSVNAVLAREPLDVVSAHSHYLATAIPGFTAALRWPQCGARNYPTGLLSDALAAITPKSASPN